MKICWNIVMVPWDAWWLSPANANVHGKILLKALPLSLVIGGGRENRALLVGFLLTILSMALWLLCLDCLALYSIHIYTSSLLNILKSLYTCEKLNQSVHCTVVVLSLLNTVRIILTIIIVRSTIETNHMTFSAPFPYVYFVSLL